MPANAVLYDILTAVQTGVVALSLSGVANANILVMKVPSDLDRDFPATKFPAVIIAPYGPEILNPADGTNLRDDILYPVLVAILAADNGDQAANFNDYLTWRQQIRHAFHNTNLGTNGALAYNVQVVPQDIVDRSAWFERNLFASGMVLHCYSREPRT